LVRLPNGTDFAVGTGFSDRERDNPPAIGATVTFRYQELSEAGVPRFPSYVGVRIDSAIKAPQKPVIAREEQKAAAPPTPLKIISTPPPASSGTTKPRYFEFAVGASNKFWEVSQEGDNMTTRWGRIGSSGQSKTKPFADAQAAAQAVARLIEEKTGE